MISPHVLRRLIPESWVVSRLPACERPRVLLTFDDGPFPHVTPAVLECLARHGARAMFFVVGRRVLRAPDVLRQIVDAGHVIGNHSFAHQPTRAWRVSACATDLLRAQETIHDLGGVTPTLYRPPLGRLNPATLLASRRCGVRLLHWSLETNDWRCRSAADAGHVAESIVNEVADRDIILLHDDNPYVVDVLGGILPLLAERFDLATAAGAFETRASIPVSRPAFASRLTA